MTVQFVDAHYLLALVNARDQDHAAALKHSQGRVGQLVTTTWVLVEVADALSAVNTRTRVARFLKGFQAEPFVEVVAPTRKQFADALDLYERRPDKDWSLTDCISPSASWSNEASSRRSRAIITLSRQASRPSCERRAERPRHLVTARH